VAAHDRHEADRLDVLRDLGRSHRRHGRRIFDEIVAVVSGKQTKSEQSGVGEAEFAPWMLGPTL
jgi:altronate hydrolase